MRENQLTADQGQVTHPRSIKQRFGCRPQIEPIRGQSINWVICDPKPPFFYLYALNQLNMQTRHVPLGQSNRQDPHMTKSKLKLTGNPINRGEQLGRRLCYSFVKNLIPKPSKQSSEESNQSDHQTYSSPHFIFTFSHGIGTRSPNSQSHHIQSFRDYQVDDSLPKFSVGPNLGIRCLIHHLSMT